MAVGPGDVLGAYELLEPIGRGGMGEVYEARHARLGHKVAIKLLHPGDNERRRVERFFREAKSAANVRHPGIVQIFDFDTTEDGLSYIVMERLEGETLGHRVHREGRFSEADAIRVTSQLLSVLATAHEQGIVHRDIKPANIFLCPNSLVTGGEQVKLLDFGIAKLNETVDGKTLTQVGTQIGTPRYMSPEQCLGTGNYDARTDLYAVGCVLYELLTGEPPFTADTSAQLYAAHVSEPTPHVRDAVPDASEELERLVLRLMEKERDDRPDSAGAVLEYLEEIGDPSRTMMDAVPRMTGRAQLSAPTIRPEKKQPTGNTAETVPMRPSSPSPPVEVTDETLLPVRSRGGMLVAGLVVALGAIITVVVVAAQGSRAQENSASPARVEADEAASAAGVPVPEKVVTPPPADAGAVAAGKEQPAKSAGDAERATTTRRERPTVRKPRVDAEPAPRPKKDDEHDRMINPF